MPASKPSLPGKLRPRRHWLARYGFALLAVVAAFFIRAGLTRLAGGSLPPYITFYPAVMLAALFGGFGPGLLATVAAALGVDYFILPPLGSLAIASVADAVGMAFFSGMGVFMSVVAELYHRARQMAAPQAAEHVLPEGGQSASRQFGQGLLLNIGMVLSLALLMLAGWLSARDLRAVAEAGQRETHSHVVIHEFDRLLSALKDAETGQRGYLLTGNEKYLEPCQAAAGLIQTQLKQLQQLTLDNALQQQRLAEIQSLSAEKIAELKHTIELRQTQGLPAALAVVVTDTGKNLMDQIRQQVAQAQAGEEQLLQQRTAAKSVQAGRTLQALLAGGVLSLLLLATVFFHLKQENLRRTKAEAEARHHRDHLSELVASRTQELSRANEQLTEEIEEHRQAKEALRQQREWLRVTLTSIGDAVLATDTAGQITFLNPAAEALTGWMENQALGQPAQNIFRIINEQTRAPGQDIIAQVLREGQTVALANHTALIARDGREIPIEDSAAPIKDASGTVSGVVFVFHDVTQHKQKEGELQKLNRTLKALHQSSQAKAHATSESEYLDGVCKDVIANCGYAMVWIGFAEADEARSVLPVACAGFAEDYLKTLKITRANDERGRGPTGTAVRTGKPCVCRNMQTDPALAPWRAEAVKRGYASSLALPLLFAGGAIGAITIYSRQVDPFSADEIQLMSQLADDVTLCLARLRAVADRQHAEDQLRLLSAAVESAANGIVITDRTAQILWVNRAFTQLTGYSRDEAVGQNPRILKSDEHSREFYLQMWDTLLNGKPWHGELVNRYKDGSLHQEEMTITPVLRDGAKITHFVAIKQDITERQRVRAALEQKSEELNRSNRDLEQFAYIASHDLQEPLRAVGGYVKLLQRRFPKNIDAKAVEYIKGAAEGAERMERLISDLLNFSRVGTRGGKFSPASFDDILKEASYNLQARIHSSQAAITHEALPTLTVDATQMMQLFQNLIGNAIKFRSDRPVEIHICARQEPERWVFSVRDNGIGIESQYFERIFQIFQRLHTRKHYPGTGIGLAICKKIVERHGGAIWVGSQPGIETTFFFSLPKTALKNQIEV